MVAAEVATVERWWCRCGGEGGDGGEGEGGHSCGGGAATVVSRAVVQWPCRVACCDGAATVVPRAVLQRSCVGAAATVLRRCAACGATTAVPRWSCRMECCGGLTACGCAACGCATVVPSAALQRSCRERCCRVARGAAATWRLRRLDAYGGAVAGRGQPDGG